MNIPHKFKAFSTLINTLPKIGYRFQKTNQYSGYIIDNNGNFSEIYIVDNKIKIGSEDFTSPLEDVIVSFNRVDCITLSRTKFWTLNIYGKKSILESALYTLHDLKVNLQYPYRSSFITYMGAIRKHLILNIDYKKNNRNEIVYTKLGFDKIQAIIDSRRPLTAKQLEQCSKTKIKFREEINQILSNKT